MFRFLLATLILIIQPHHACALFCCGNSAVEKEGAGRQRSSASCCETRPAPRSKPKHSCLSMGGRITPSWPTTSTSQNRYSNRESGSPKPERRCCAKTPAQGSVSTTSCMAKSVPPTCAATKCSSWNNTVGGCSTSASAFDRTTDGGAGCCDPCCYECESGRPLLPSKNDSLDRSLDLAWHGYFVGVPLSIASATTPDILWDVGRKLPRSHTQRHAWLGIWLK